MTPAPSTGPEDELDRALAEELQAEVAEVFAGADLLDRIRRDDNDGAAGLLDARPRGGRTRVWLTLVAAAAAVMFVVLFVAGEGGEREVATREAPESDGTTVVADGVSASGPWSVVEYVETDSRFVDEPSTCLRFEPTIEEGPFFCGSRDDLLGEHGRIVPRPGRLGDELVFAGVVSEEVSQVNVTIDGATTAVDPYRWVSADLGLVVVTLNGSDDVVWNVELLDADGTQLSTGGGNLTGG